MVREVIDAERVRRRIGEMAVQVAADYAGTEPVFVGVLNGAAQFMLEVIGRLPAVLQERLLYDFVQVSSYQGRANRDQVSLHRECGVEVRDQDVLVFEGIVDTGRTVERVLETLGARGPRSLRVCTFLDKPSRRRCPVPVDYCGFSIPDLFVVGFGLDQDQRYRALRYIGVVE
ncbi:MAG: hypoxanthine phosphoribosyltransferase [Candidatus Latescibacterota bacterium]